jgi:hypothetical protein
VDSRFLSPSLDLSGRWRAVLFRSGVSKLMSAMVRRHLYFGPRCKTRSRRAGAMGFGWGDAERIDEGDEVAEVIAVGRVGELLTE